MNDNKSEEILNLTNSGNNDNAGIKFNDLMFESILENKTIILSLIPLVIGHYLQDNLFTRSISKVTSNLPEFVQTANTSSVLTLLLPYIISLVMFYISSITYTNKINQIEIDTIHRLTNKIVESVKTSKKSFNVNDLMMHVKKIVESKNIFKIIVSYIIPTIIVIIGVIYNFAKADIRYSIIILIVIAILIYITVDLELNTVTQIMKSENTANELFDELHDIMANIETVVTNDSTQSELETFRSVSNKTLNDYCESDTTNINTTYFLQILSLLTVIFINYLSYQLYSNGTIGSEIFISTVLMTMIFMDYYTYLVYSLMDMVNDTGKMYEIDHYFSQFKIDLQNKLQNTQINNTNSNNDVFKKKYLHKIKMINVNVDYENKTVFDNLNLEINKQNKVVLVGPIGSGKSTILKVLAGVVKYHGLILIDGNDISKDPNFISTNISYVSQHPKLFNKSIYHNIVYGTQYANNNPNSKTLVIQKLEQFGVMDFINSFPNKLDTIVGKEGNKLSGGQKHMVALIRTLIQDRPIILLDEPTSSLDVKNKKTIIDIIRNINNKTIIVTTHDSDLLKVFQHKINVNNL